MRRTRSQAAGRRAAALLAGLVWLAAGAVPLRGQESGTEPVPGPPAPSYRFDVAMDAAAHILRGTVEVRLPPDDPRPRDVWWFHLPPNRFARPDPRGPRRRTGSVPFGFVYTDPVETDPAFPAGFSRGDIRILAVRDAAGRTLTFSLGDNEQLPQGFSATDALLRVAFPPGTAGDRVTIAFETRLPRRYWDGWSESGIFAERWHPVLLEFREGGWVRAPGVPTPGRYTARVTVSEAGLLVLPGGRPRAAFPDETVEFAPRPTPSRTFPLIFMRRYRSVGLDEAGVHIASVFRPGQERVGALVLDIAAEFLAWVRETYRMEFPKPALTLVETDAVSGDVGTADGIVAIPEVDYRESTLLDRVLVGRVSRAIAQQWFGETLWVNEESEAWLIYGPAGLLALRFFEDLYGPDAPTHELTDWLAPRYREHYFEEPVRALVRQGMDAPLLTSLWHAPRQRVARVVIHHKAPLVLRQLEYAMLPDRFARALRRLARNGAYQPLTTTGFQRALESDAGIDLAWFFEPWVRGVTRLDYTLEDVREATTPTGHRLEVVLLRSEGPPTPVDVQVLTEAGETISRRWAGASARATLIFHTLSPPARVTLDPDEYLMEVDRQDNYSAVNVRVRPLFDWAKNREVFVSLLGRAGGNAIDGNYVGLGLGVTTDADNSFYAIPGYGQESEELIYFVGWTHQRLIWPRLSFQLTRTRLGGRDFLEFAFAYQHDTPERSSLRSTLAFRAERVDGLPADTGTGSALQTPGHNNNINLQEDYFVQLDGPTYHGLSLEAEHSERSYDSDFTYTLGRLSLLNGVQLGHRHRVELEAIRGGIDGTAPVQKRFLLGDPLVLRGYPRTLKLVSDQMMAARLDYRWIFSRGVHGREIQTRNVSAILSVDVGKGWNNGESPSDRRQRQNAGLGIEVELDFLNQVAFPVRVEVARPFNDPEYDRTQFIFFQALAFF